MVNRIEWRAAVQYKMVISFSYCAKKGFIRFVICGLWATIVLGSREMETRQKKEWPRTQRNPKRLISIWLSVQGAQGRGASSSFRRSSCRVFVDDIYLSLIFAIKHNKYKFKHISCVEQSLTPNCLPDWRKPLWYALFTIQRKLMPNWPWIKLHDISAYDKWKPESTKISFSSQSLATQCQIDCAYTPMLFYSVLFLSLCKDKT